MANLHSEFITFHDRVALTSAKKESLRTARNAIRERIRKYFRENLKVTIPKFLGQGSYAMGTAVNPLDGEFDIDDGVYLQHLDENNDREWPTPDTTHRWLVKATTGHTNEKPLDKSTCVRVRYAGHYHVDLPSYGELNGEYLLAEKGVKGWHRSDPLSLTVWFRERVKAQGEQLRRVVRYLKAWDDFQSGRRGKMPGGLILTVLAVRKFKADERDDVSLSNTATAIFYAVHPVFCVYNPVNPAEELTARLTDDQKARFQDAVSDLAIRGAKAVGADAPEESSKLWRSQLGDRFPNVEKTITIGRKQEDAAKLAAAYGAKNPAKPWAHL